MSKHLMVVAVAVAVSACGGPGAKIASGKQGAAEAVYALSSPTQQPAPGDITVNGNGTFGLKCKDGGSAALSGFASGQAGPTGGSFTGGFTIEYQSCGLATKQGTVVVNGKLTMSQAVSAGQSGAAFEQTFKGKVTLSGAIDDFLDVDVRQVLNATATGGGAVAMNLKGTVSNSSGTYTFDEAVDVTPGQISVQSSGSAKP